MPLLILLVTSCEEPGVVGSEFVETGSEVFADTMKVGDFKMATDVTVFTGNKPYLSVGQYDDALFGEVTAVGLMRPALVHSDDTLLPDATMSLALDISTGNVYGDTTSTTTLELVEIAQSWRAGSWKINSRLDTTNNVLATVEIDMEDSVVVELPNSFYQRYRDFHYDNSSSVDSLYRYDFKGFALRPTGGDKILAISGSATRFLINNPEEDTLATTFALSDWAYTLDRQNVPPIPDSLNRIYSTQEQIANFMFESDSAALGSKNIARAEMTLYQDRERMQNSLPQNHVRPVPDVLDLYLRETEVLEYSLESVSPSFQVQVDSTDYTYRVGLTRYVNEQLFGDSIPGRFLGTLRSNDGIIRSAVVSNAKATKKFPKLLLTNVNIDSDSN